MSFDIRYKPPKYLKKGTHQHNCNNHYTATLTRPIDSRRALVPLDTILLARGDIVRVRVRRTRNNNIRILAQHALGDQARPDGLAQPAAGHRCQLAGHDEHYEVADAQKLNVDCAWGPLIREVRETLQVTV